MDFSGRARRKEYWYFTLFNIIIGMILVFIDVMVGGFFPNVGMGLIGSIYLLATIVPSIAVAVRRLHDIGRSGWWSLIVLVPFIGAIVFIVFMVLDSKPGDNQFGSNPKLATA